MSVRTSVKRAFERTLVGSGAARFFLRRRGPERALVLAYHNVVPRGEKAVGDRSLHLSQERFAEQLDVLLETHDVVGIDRLTEAAGPSDRRPMAVITFDDAYAGAMTAGLEEVLRRGLPATVFVNPGAIDWPGFWWDRLADPASGVLDPRVRGQALDTLGGRQEPVLAWARSEGLRWHDVPEHARPASVDVLSSFDDRAQITFGSHSWEHARLSALDEESLRADLERTRAWLDRTLSNTVPWLSYPYGLTASSVEWIVARIGEHALLVSGGGTRRPVPSNMSTRVPRANIPSGSSREGFVARVLLAG